MFYLLDSRCSLCGYWGVPFGLYDRREHRTSFFKRDDFELLLHCDGRHDIDVESLSGRGRNLLQGLLEIGAVASCPEGGRLEPHQEYRNFKTKYREDIQLSITGLCNYRCRHCFQSAPEGKLGTISLERLMDYADQMVACGVRRVSFTGGEPLYRDDFWQVFDGFTERDVYVENIFTNGGLLNREWIDELNRRVAAGVDKPSISVSFDGVGQHDWLRGVAGAEKAALDAIRLCKENGYDVGCSMCLHKGNTHTLRDTVRLLAGMGVTSLKVNVARPEGEWKRETENVLTTAEGWEAYLEYIPQYFEDGAPISLMLEGCFMCNAGTTLWNTPNDRSDDEGWRDRLCCGVLRRHFYVSPQGAVVPCMSMAGTDVEAKFPNLNETPLRDILQPGTTFIKKSELTAGQLAEANAECRECEYLPKCWGGCRACGAIEKGWYEDIDPYTCIWHKDRWRSRFEAAAEKGIAAMSPELREVVERNNAAIEEHDRQVRVRLGLEDDHPGERMSC